MINVIFYHAASMINLEQSHNQFSRDRGYSAAVSMHSTPHYLFVIADIIRETQAAYKDKSIES